MAAFSSAAFWGHVPRGLTIVHSPTRGGRTARSGRKAAKQKAAEQEAEKKTAEPEQKAAEQKAAEEEAAVRKTAEGEAAEPAAPARKPRPTRRTRSCDAWHPLEHAQGLGDVSSDGDSSFRLDGETLSAGAEDTGRRALEPLTPLPRPRRKSRSGTVSRAETQ